MTNASVLSVSKEILKQASDKKISLRPLKLMKLTYMAHAVSLAVIDEPIFLENVEAWKYGPVIDALYQKTKQFGNTEIPVDALDSYCTDDLSPIAEKIIEIFVRKFGYITGAQLATLAHQPDSPWHKIWHEGGGKFSFGEVIPNGLIASHYKDWLNI